MTLIRGKKEEMIKDDDELQLNANLSFGFKSTSYADEVEIFDYISDSFKSIENNLADYNYMIQIANNYLSTNNQISSTYIKNFDGESAAMIVTGISTLPNNDTTNTNTGGSGTTTSETNADTNNTNNDVQSKPVEEANSIELGTNKKEILGIVRTNGGRLRVRSGPSTSSKVIDKLANGEVVDVVERGDKWTKVAFLVESERTEGYVSNSYLNVYDPNIASNLGYVKTNGGKLRVRSGPSTSFKVIDKLANGEVVDVLEQGDKWTKVVFLVEGERTEGYVSNNYLIVPTYVKK